MQRYFLRVFSLYVLYVSSFACATAEPLPPAVGRPSPHIALLLPLKSSSFGSIAEVVKQGFLAAAGVEVTNPLSLPVRVYGSFDEGNDIVTLYRQAVLDGAVGVVGPLTRDGVAALAAQPTLAVATLALNVIDQKPIPTRMYFFGMAIEAEARQVAQMAIRNGQHHALVVSAPTQLSKRLQMAFEEDWVAAGGTIEREIEFNGDPSVFVADAIPPDTMMFMATDAATARQIRPYLPNKLPIYATSQVFSGVDATLINYDLEGIRFVDMPWLLQQDHAAVMSYPRSTEPLSIQNERFFALGIDAYRLIYVLIDNSYKTALPLDGVSGQIVLDHQTFQRKPITATFVQGQALISEGTGAVKPPVFPGLEKAQGLSSKSPVQ